ncbi:unnamed protein product, partial [Didymodactylos carnosus]
GAQCEITSKRFNISDSHRVSKRLLNIITDIPVRYSAVYSASCVAKPCFNGGTCIDSSFGFTCTCDEDFIGTLCEVWLTDYVGRHVLLTYCVRISAPPGHLMTLDKLLMS